MRSHKYSFKRIIALLFGILLIGAQAGMIPSDASYALGSDDNAVLAFTSDVHNDQQNYDGETRLGTWIDNVINTYGKIDAMAFGGDMAQYNSADTKFWSETQRVMNVVEGKGIAAYYTTGNHEYDHDSNISNDFSPNKNDTTKKYIQNDWAVSDGNQNYRIYCMGVGEASNYTYVNNAYTENQVNTLRDKLAAVDNSKPIFIITHFPLHYCKQNYSSSSRTITRASDVIDVLNTAANGGTPNDTSDDKKIVFIWGHNHSLNNPPDAHYDTIYQKGSELEYKSGQTKNLDFYYAAAGSMSDTEKDAGSGKVEGKGLVATVNSNDQISLAYRKADGTTVTKNGGPYTEQDTDDSETPDTTGNKAYVLTETLTPGKNYLIVSANSGNAYALRNNSGSVSREAVTIDGDTIYSDNEDIVFEAQGSGTTINDLHNGNRFLKASSSGLQLNTAAGESRPWEYDGSNNQLTNFKVSNGTPGTHYYVYYENNNFAASSSTVSSHVVYLFEESDEPVVPTVSHTVTFRVENGKWNDDSTTDKTVTLSGPAGTELKLSADQIPAVGNKPDNGYKSGNWDVTPDTDTSLTGDVTYTYTYEEQEAQGSEKAYVLTDTLSPGKKYIIATANSGLAHALTNNNGSSSATDVTVSDNTIYSDNDNIVFTAGGSGTTVNNLNNGEKYLSTGNPVKFVNSAPSGQTWEYSSSNNHLTMKSGNTTNYYYYSTTGTTKQFRTRTDTTSSSSLVVYIFEEVAPSDVSYTVTFQVENGKWNDNSGEDKTVTLSGPADTEFKLSADQIPAVGEKPNTHYKVGAWDVTPSATTAITEDTTYKYTYEYVDHDWGSGEVTLPATCTEDGVKTYTCTICGETKDETIHAPGHSWEDEFTEDVPPTCTEAGSESKHCSVCDAIDESTVTEIPASEHNFGEWTEVNPSTCEDSGLEQRTCETCGIVESRDLNPSGHDWAEEFTVDVEPTCTTEGSKSIHCNNCEAVKDSETIPALGHDYQDVEGSAQAATCTEAGKNANQECSRCHDVIEGTVIPAAGHSWDNGTVTTDPTCTAKGVQTFNCENCNATRTEDVDALGHDMTNHPAVAETCTTAGNSKYYSCDRCEKFFSDEEGETEIDENSWVIAAKGHNYGDWTKLDDNQHQRVCENDSTHVETADHTWNNGVVTTDPTCTAKGVKTFTCSVCNGTKTAEVDALGHNMTEHVATAETCEEAGNSAYYSCDKCNKYFSDEEGETEIDENSWVIAAKGHNYGAWTKLDDNQHQRVCENDSTHIETANHSWDEGEVTTGATCTEAGVKTYTCTACGATKTENLAVLGHQTELHPAVVATCTEPGNNAYYSCERCDKYFSDQVGLLEIEKDNWIVPAKGHKYGDWTKIDDNQHRKVCENDSTHVETADHSWNDGVVTTDPTCTAKGVKTFTCSVCNGTKTDDIEELGHVWVEATYTTPKTCSRCHLTEGEAMSYDSSEERYVEVTQFVNGRDYIVAVTKDETSVYAIDNENGSGNTSTATLQVMPGEGDEPAYIVTDKVGVPWTYTANDKHLANQGKYLNRDEQGVMANLVADDGGREVTIVDGHLQLKKSNSNSRYFMTCNNGTLALVMSDTATGSEVRLFEKTTVEIRKQNIKFVDEDGNVLQDSMVERGKTPSYAGETPTKEDDEDYTYTFVGWTDGTATYGPEDTLPAATVDATYTVVFTKTEKHHHTWNSGEITKQPTCTTKGVKTFTCTVCEEIKTEEVDALGHDMTPHAATAETCEEAGNSAYYSCDKCNKYFSDEEGNTEINENSWVIPAKGHKYGGWTKLNDNQHRRVCENDSTHVETADHTWDDGEITTQPTCTAKGVKTFTCTACGATKTADVNPLGHNMDEHVAIAETCEDAGNSAYYSCDKCNKYFSDEEGNTEINENSWVIPKLGHSFKNYTSDGNATCTADGTKTAKCERCEETNTIADDDSKLGHDYQEVENSAVAATCTEDGKEADQKCSRCDDVKEGATIEKKGHTEETISAVDATCTAGGKTAGKKCSVCNTILEAPTDTQKLGHNWKDATCTKAKTCTRCNATEGSALGHDYKDVPGTAKAATCTAAGKKADQKCTRCNNEKAGAAIPATAHKTDGGKVTKAATCTANGTKTYTCTACKKVIKTETIKATGHKYGAWVNLNASQHKRVCANDKSHVERANHSWDGGKVTKAATTSAEGVKTYTCKTCKATKTEAIPKKPIPAKPIAAARATANGDTAVTINWNKVTGADRYLVYFARCNTAKKKYSCKKVATVNGKTLKWSKKKLAKNTYYKFYVVAQKKTNGKYKTIATSKDGHFITGNGTGNYTNPKSLTLNKTAITLKKGKTATIKGTVTKVKSGKKLETTHSKLLRFVSNNTSIATVNASGKVTAKSKGTCIIYVQTINGIWKTCKITVR